MVKKREIRVKCAIELFVQNNKMCKKLYWDLINSNMNMNRRDVQTGCSGYVHKNTGDENMYVFQ